MTSTNWSTNHPKRNRKEDSTSASVQRQLFLPSSSFLKASGGTHKPLLWVKHFITSHPCWQVDVLITCRAFKACRMKSWLLQLLFLFTSSNYLNNWASVSCSYSVLLFIMERFRAVDYKFWVVFHGDRLNHLTKEGLLGGDFEGHLGIRQKCVSL